jgi:hypothetical protein
VQPGQFVSVYRECPTGEVAVSGGYSIAAAAPIQSMLNVLGDEPVTGKAGTVPIGWQVGVLNGSWDTSATISVYVVCAGQEATS